MAVRIEVSTFAQCRPEHVWRKFQNIKEWPWWNPAIGQVKWLKGEPWREGSEITLDIVRPRRMTINAAIVECAPPNLVHWSGKRLWIRGEHWFRFEERTDGTTLLSTRQALSGVLTLLITKTMRRDGERTLQLWLEALKIEAEKLARQEAAA